MKTNKTRKNRKAGFTLVELIVVIAILAILAGVAVPVYSGYIKKANQADDNVLLDALNTAFQAASVEGGQYDGRPASASASLASDGSVSSVKSSADTDGTLFAKYFAGNQGSKFRNYVLLRYVKSKGLFEGYASGEEISVPYGDDTITVSAAEVAAFQASGFASLDNDPDADAITELMGEVDNVTAGAAQVLSTSARTAMLNDTGFSSFLTELGYTAEEIDAMKGSATNPELGNKLANAMVLYTASKTKNLTASEIIDAFNAGSGFSTIANLNNGIADFATYSTIPYAMMLAYVNSEYAEGQQVSLYGRNNFIDVVKLFNEGGTYKVGAKKYTVGGSDNLTSLTDVTKLQDYICNSEGFIAYMQTDQAQTDLSGFLSAMSMLDNNRSSLGEQNISSILSDGFTDQTLINMLNSALGN